jgi:hypothetical protein
MGNRITSVIETHGLIAASRNGCTTCRPVVLESKLTGGLSTFDNYGLNVEGIGTGLAGLDVQGNGAKSGCGIQDVRVFGGHCESHNSSGSAANAICINVANADATINGFDASGAPATGGAVIAVSNTLGHASVSVRNVDNLGWTYTISDPVNTNYLGAAPSANYKLPEYWMQDTSWRSTDATGVTTGSAIISVPSISPTGADLLGGIGDMETGTSTTPTGWNTGAGACGGTGNSNVACTFTRNGTTAALGTYSLSLDLTTNLYTAPTTVGAFTSAVYTLTAGTPYTIGLYAKNDGVVSASGYAKLFNGSTTYIAQTTVALTSSFAWSTFSYTPSSTITVQVQAGAQYAAGATGTTWVDGVVILPAAVLTPNTLLIASSPTTTASATAAEIVAAIGATPVASATSATNVSGTVAVGNGGTGATTAGGALTNLGAAASATTVNGHALSANFTTGELNYFCAGTVGTANSTAYYLTPGGGSTSIGCSASSGMPRQMAKAGTITACYATASVGGAASGSGTLSLSKVSYSGTPGALTATPTNTAVCVLGIGTGKTQCNNTGLSVSFVAGDTLFGVVTTGQGTDTTANINMTCVF